MKKKYGFAGKNLRNKNLVVSLVLVAAFISLASSDFPKKGLPSKRQALSFHVAKELISFVVNKLSCKIKTWQFTNHKYC